MSGKNPRLNPLESRKQLLIAESELNRAHLLHELDTLAGEVHALANQAKTIGSIASAVASLVAGLTSFRRKQPASAAEKPSVVANPHEGRRDGFHLLGVVSHPAQIVVGSRVTPRLRRWPRIN